jgi:hypothetical protein
MTKEVPQRGPEIFGLLNVEAMNMGAEVYLHGPNHIGTNYQFIGTPKQVKRLTGLYNHLVKQLDSGTLPNSDKYM